MQIRTIHAMISGRVQGVWYRAWTVETATKLGLNGWVRNRANGTVEAVFSGSSEQVEKMLSLCWQGPTAARVDQVETTDTPPIQTSGFQQRPTL